MADDTSDRTWGEYRRLILAELERIRFDIEAIKNKIEQFRQEDIAQIKTDIALLKFQAAMWGGTAGVLITLATTVIPRLILK